LACYIYVACVVYGKCPGAVVTVFGTVVMRNPQLVSVGVVLNCRIVVACAGPSRGARHINIAETVHDDGASGIVTRCRTVVASDP
jgi:hypothetical protein